MADRAWTAPVLASLLSLAVACSGATESRRLDRLQEPTPRAGGGVLLEAADVPELRLSLAESEADEETAGFLSAELDVLEGRFTRGFDRYAEVFAARPNSLLGALSIGRMVALAQTVSGFERRAAPTVDRAEADGDLHPLALHYANALAIELAWANYQVVDRANASPFSADALGLPDEWRMAGPFSQSARLDLTRPEPYDEHVVLAARYAPEGRRIETSIVLGNGPTLKPSIPSTGTYVLETWVELSRARDLLVVLESGLGAQVSVDGETLITRLETGPYQARVRVAVVRLEGGWHRVRLRLGWDSETEVRLRLIPLGTEPADVAPRPALALSFSARPPEGTALGVATPLWTEERFLEETLPADVLEPDGALGAFALLRLATDFSRSDLADRALAVLEALGGSGSPMVAVATARVASERHDLAPNVRYNRRVAAIREALEVAPSAHGAALPLVGILASDGREDEALRLARRLGDWLAGEPGYWISLYELYTRRGWDELAEAALERTLRLEPHSCYALRELIDLYHFRDHYPDPAELPEPFQTCRAGLLYQVETVLLPRGSVDEAVELLRFLVGRSPEDGYTQRRLFDLLMGLGRTEEALDSLAIAHRYGLPDSEVALRETDWLLAEGELERARARIETALREERPGDYQLLRAAALLDDERLFDDLRVDTSSAIERYRREAGAPGAGAVYALDYGAYRFFRDGSYVSLTHQILHLTSREALGDYGEVSVPSRAILLRARTIKADGTFLEPDNIPGKETLSMPNLEVGDFIEYEYLDVAGPSRGRHWTVLGPRFYFQVFDAPLTHSELVIDVPEDWSELTFDVRAGAPQPEITRHDDWRRYRFVVRDSGLPVDESGSPQLDELLPSVRFAHDYTWSDVRRVFLERRLTVVRQTPALTALAHALAAEARDDRGAVRRIFRYLVDNIEETGGFLSSHASWTFRAGEGERLPLLLALLEAAGFEADMVFLRARANDVMRSPIPDADELPNTAVRVRLDDDEIWLEPSRDYAPFDYLRPDIQGSSGVVMAMGPEGQVEWVSSPTWPADTNRQIIDLRIELDEAGDFVAEANEQIPLRNAPEMRLYLDQLQDERELIVGLEGGLSSSFSGVVVDDVSVEGADTPDAPAVIVYRFHGTGLATAGDGELSIVRRILDRRLRATLGAQAQRVHPLVLDYPFAESVRITFVLPDGYTFTEIPEPILVDSPWLSYERSVGEGGVGSGQVTLVRDITLSVGRVSPEAYPTLLDALRLVDDAETVRLVGHR